MVAKKAKPPPDDPVQSERFVATAKQVEADVSGNVFARAFKKIVHKRRWRAPPHS